jgi:hypothetical protein
MMASWQHFVVFSATLVLGFGGDVTAGQPPNILFIAIDDQNDWIGHLGGQGGGCRRAPEVAAGQ